MTESASIAPRTSAFSDSCQGPSPCQSTKCLAKTPATSIPILFALFSSCHSHVRVVNQPQAQDATLSSGKFLHLAGRCNGLCVFICSSFLVTSVTNFAFRVYAALAVFGDCDGELMFWLLSSAACGTTCPHASCLLFMFALCADKVRVVVLQFPDPLCEACAIL